MGVSAPVPGVPTGAKVTAISQSAITKSASAIITLDPPPSIISVSVTPGYVNMPANQTQQFTATVTGVGNFNPAVTWSVGPAGIILPSYGTISSNGVYTPPNNLTDPTPVNITATSVADPTQSAIVSAQVFPAPVITSITPNPARAGDQIFITGIGLSPLVSIQFTGPNHMTIPVSAYDPGAAVPFSTVSGPVRVTTQLPGFKPVTSNSLQFTRIPALRIRATDRDLGAGESTTFAHRILGMPSAKSIQWTTDVGNIDSSGVYQPPFITKDSFAHIQGCIAGTQICQSEILGLRAFRITPYPASVRVGQSLQLESIPPGAQWTDLTGGGSLTPGGLYTAGKRAADGGGRPVSATLMGATEKATVGVTGSVPGVVSEVSDYIDYTLLPMPLGTNNLTVAVSGNYLYALAYGNFSNYPPDQGDFWIDVYDISDPIHPVWIDAVETALNGSMYTYGKYLYQVGSGNVPDSSQIAVFSIAGIRPELIAEASILPPVSNLTFSDGIVWGSADTSDQVIIERFNLQGGRIVETDYQLPPPNGAGPSSTLTSTPMGTDTRLYVFTTLDAYSASASSELDTFDLTVSPPALLQSQSISPAYYYSAFMGSFIILGGDLYDLSSGLPVKVSTLPPMSLGNPLDFNGRQLLTGTLQNGLQVTDLSDLDQPRFSSELIDETLPRTGVMSGRYVFTGGVAIRVFDAGPAGGAVVKTPPVGPFLASVAFDSVIYESHLFEAIETDQNSFVSIIDLSRKPPSELSEFDTGLANPIAVAVSGSTMYVGTDQSLVVADISNPASPRMVGSIPGAVTTLSVWGHHLYVGTTDAHLFTYNISNPLAPVQVSSLSLPVAAVRLRASHFLLFVADDISGLLTYSLANPSAPILVSEYRPAGAVGDLAIDGNMVFMASDQGLVIADASNPFHPVKVGQAFLPQLYAYTSASAMAFGITLRNKIAYVGTWEDGGTIYGFDYSVAAHPRMVAVMPEGGQICDFVLTLANDGTDLFDGGQLEAFPFLDVDISRPDNVINFYPIFASGITPVQAHPCADFATAHSSQAANSAQSDSVQATYGSQRKRLSRRVR